MSSDCEIVVDLWTNWNQTTTVDGTDPTACCLMGGVSCTDGNVTKIEWGSQTPPLTGSIPPEIGNLISLKGL